jgi:hypothetical protein
VAFTAEHDVYADTNFQAMRTQSFSRSYGLSAGQKGPNRLEQTAVVFPSADLAQKSLALSQTQWNACANREVDVVLGYENGRGFTLGSVKRDGDLITVSMGYSGGETGPDVVEGFRRQATLGAAVACARSHPTFVAARQRPGWWDRKNWPLVAILVGGVVDGHHANTFHRSRPLLALYGGVSPQRRLHLGPPLGGDEGSHDLDDATHLGHHVDHVVLALCLPQCLRSPAAA